ncbi:Cation efflux system protein CusC precursor [Roseimaritima multifibrata]|uniref:Cation efflux system protein CusC n=1 Tax=Roseimaritima multifibrata TaxID=1930274 RepID=A0A517MM88_9BACT|nr:TolC family protein [Roseimaritima multifibrata]QDS96001.1 Cation efflux system protein CusC precursor [Roseimaritima multifibrata]
MSTHFVEFANRISANRGQAAILLAGALLAATGCKTPPLQQAQPGPVMPESYSSPSSFTNHYADLSSDDTDQSEHASKPDINVPENTHSSNKVVPANASPADAAEEDIKFASFIQTATELDLQEPTAPQDVVLESGSITTDAAPTTVTTPTIVNNQFENSATMSRYEFFNDPDLLGLIDQALVGNQELKILAQEVRIACLEVQARSGEYRPFVTLGARAGLEKPGQYTRAGAVEEQLEVVPGREFPDPLPDFLVGADVSWELDIWKALRNAQSAAAMRYLGTNDGRNYIVTRLVAEIAENYYELLALDNQLETLGRTIELQKQSLEVANAKKQAGRGTELAVQRFQAEVRKNESERLIIQQQIIEAENRINFIVGRYPQPIQRPSSNYIDLNLQTLAVGIPSQLLQNRADIKQAERELAAAGLDVKVARARFYPSLSLTAGVGWNAFSTGYLFKTPESLIYGVAGELVGPLINKRAIKASYLSANARQLQAIYDYQRTILEAHIEVVNYMTKVDNYRQSIEVKKQQLDALEASVDSASKLFQSARVEYVEVLLVQREFMEAKMGLIETKQQQLNAIVNAYQALGGGGGGLPSFTN